MNFRFYDFNSRMTSMYKSVRINLGKLLVKIPDLKSQVKFLQETKVLPITQTCDPCNKVLTKLATKSNFVYFQCGLCRKRISIRRGTVLWNSKLSLRRFILLVYSFTQHNWTYKQVDTEVCITSDEDENTTSKTLSSKSIDKYSKYFREIIADFMIDTEKVVKTRWEVFLIFITFLRVIKRLGVQDLWLRLMNLSLESESTTKEQ